jgi:elongation factor G
VADFHTAVVDQVVEVDEELMEQYLEQGKIDPDQLEAPFKKAMREGHLVPSASHPPARDVGVKELIDIFVNLCPNPLEGNPRTFEYTEGGEKKELLPVADDSKPLLAHVFKVSSDPYVGKLSVFRVHQGHVGRTFRRASIRSERPFGSRTFSNSKARNTLKSTRSSRATSAPSRRLMRSTTTPSCTRTTFPRTFI